MVLFLLMPLYLVGFFLRRLKARIVALFNTITNRNTDTPGADDTSTEDNGNVSPCSIICQLLQTLFGGSGATTVINSLPGSLLQFITGGAIGPVTTIEGTDEDEEGVTEELCFFEKNKSILFLTETLNILRLLKRRYAEKKVYKISDNRQFEGRVAVITGADKEIGKYLTLYLLKYGFKVVMGVKDPEKDNLKIDRLNRDYQNQVKALKLDLSSLESVRQFAKAVATQENKIDLLINSANDYETERVITREGFEKNLVQNYLGHFLLTNLLLKNLKQSENGRVVNVTSMAHHFGTINLNDMQLSEQYHPFRAYAQSKLAQIVFNHQLAKRLKESRVTTYVVNPEIIRETSDSYQNFLLNEFISRISNPENGSQTVLYVALEDKLKSESGFYYSDLKRKNKLICKTLSKKLWTLSEELVQIEPESSVSSNQTENTANTSIKPNAGHVIS